MRIGGNRHLGYCTNVGGGASSTEELVGFLTRVMAPLRARLAPEGGLGVGLRVSAAQAAELRRPEKLAVLRDALEEGGLYVFTLNGFVFGEFNGGRVKESVFSVGWSDPRRLGYTCDLAELLCALLGGEEEGGISSLPLSFKGWHAGSSLREESEASLMLARTAARLYELRLETGKLVHLDLEPEPFGLLETGGECARFFEQRLFEPGERLLRERFGLGAGAAADALRAHLRVCYDLCHQHVEYESPPEFLASLARAGIRLGKVQVSSALALELEGLSQRAEQREALLPFLDRRYLHQVMERRRDGRIRYLGDLADVLDRIADPEAAEWRIHYHVPISLESIGPLGTGQGAIREAMTELAARPALCSHFEIETYTWDVLPGGLKRELVDSMEEEYRWLLPELGHSVRAGMERAVGA